MRVSRVHQRAGQAGGDKDYNHLDVDRRPLQMTQEACQAVHRNHHQRRTDCLAHRQPHQHDKGRHNQKAAADAQKAGKQAHARTRENRHQPAAPTFRCPAASA